jgi:hypothetical protein
MDQNQKALPEPEDDRDTKLLADILRHGWAIIGVTADEEGPGFAYSIGLFRSYGHPEFFVVGLDKDYMFAMIDDLAGRIKAGNKFDDLDEVHDVLEKYSCLFRQMERKHYRDYLGYAGWFYQGDGFPVLQCAWPDSKYRYPWHPDFDEKQAARQPMLFDSQLWPFQAGGNRAVFTTKPVVHDHLPVLLVSHDGDDDWQFLCGTTNDPEDALIVSLGFMLQHDPTLAEVADLPEGWCATRDSPGTQWEREFDEQDDDKG